MRRFDPDPRLQLSSPWTRRDLLAATVLSLATAAFVLWQNSRLAVLWDIGYLLDSAYRMSLGQLPYRDLPFVHSPLTFLLQAAILRLTGRVYFHHVIYAAAAGALATVLTWRLALGILRTRRLPQASVLSLRRMRPGFAGYTWTISLLISSPLTCLGIYSIFPTPFYDCDCILSILIALLLLRGLDSPSRPSRLRACTAGFALIPPIFFKQNIGLPFLFTTFAALLLLLVFGRFRRDDVQASIPHPSTLLTVLAAAFAILLASALLLHLTVGIGNYVYWTVQFASQRRLPGFADVLGIFAEPALLWQIPAVAVALLLLRTRAAFRLWTRILVFALLGSPFLWTLLLLLLHTDPDDRADDLLALWPLVLILAAAFALVSLILALKRRTLTLRTLLPFVLLATIFGTLLSQQLWGSTYAIWPLFVLLLAELLACIAAGLDSPQTTPLVPALAAVVAATLLTCGTLYAASAERLDYAQLHDGPLQRSTLPALRGMATRGTYLPAFDQMVRFTDAEIPRDDGILLLPGEDPFYYATGRTPQFPVLLFDTTCNPYTPAQIAQIARERNIRWIIVKRTLQLTADPMPQQDATLHLLAQQFSLYRQLDSYDIYRRNAP